MASPKITFLTPFRWFVDPDRAFLGQNLQNKIIRFFPDPEEATRLRMVQAYAIKLVCHANRPVDVPLTAKQAQLLLKPIFSHGKCLDVDWEFVQAKSKTMLPVVDFQLFFSVPEV